MKKTWQIVSVVVAVLALFITVWQTLLTRQSTKHELGGTLSALVGERQVAIGETADVVVFTTDGVVNLSDIDVVPTFKNVSKYTVHDILAEYVVSGNVALSYADFYSSLSQGGRTTVQRNERELYAHRQTEQPFVSLSVTGSEAHSTIETSVTYDGAMMPFQYTTNLLVMRVAKRSDQTVEQWKQRCREAAQRRLDGRKVDIYYCSSDYVSKEEDVTLIQQVAQTKPTEQKSEIAKSVVKTKPDKLVEPATSENAFTDSAEEKCGLLVNSEYNPTEGTLRVSYKPSTRQRNLLFWLSCNFVKNNYENYLYYQISSNQNDSVYFIHSPTKNGNNAKKYYAIDVMEEDSTLLKGIIIDNKIVRNRTGKTIICCVETEKTITYQVLSGKWCGYKRHKFDSEVTNIKAFSVVKGKRIKATEGYSWLFGLLLPFCFVFPVKALYYIFKNKFNLREAVEDWGVPYDSNVFEWTAIIFTLVYVVFSVVIIVWNIVMATPPSV